VATAVDRVAVGAPINGTVEVAGPQQFQLAEFVHMGLAAKGDAREVVSDPKARYYGARLRERTLLPNENATLFSTRFEDWLTQAVVR
jgi:hypothetical protein